MAKAIVLTNITDGSTITVDGQAVYTLSSADVAANKVTAAGVGTFDFTNPAKTTFTADAALAGEIILTATDATIVSADFSKATAGVKIATTADMLTVTSGAGNDTIASDQAGVINAGAGNDLVSITAGDNKVTLGAGADTLELTGGKATVADYNYYEGDVIKSTDTVKLTADGKLDIGGGSIVSGANGVAVQDNWYAAKVDNASAITDYFTAVGGNNVNVTKDLSKSVIANVVDASGAKSANITLGHGNDTVSLSSGVDTVAVGKSAGNNVTDISSDDVITIDGVNLSNISLVAATSAGNTDKVAVKYAASTVETGVATTGGSLNFNDGSKTHKLAFDDLTTGGNITYATASDADWVLGTATGGTTLEVGDTTHLHETDKYVNITNIKVAADLDLKAPISLTGATGKNNNIDATNAKVGVAVWGFSSGTDTIALSTTNKAQDTVWFGAGDGNDTISGFAYGTASDSDVLYLKDTKTLKDIDVAFDTGKAKFTVGKAVASVGANTVANSSDVAQIKLADEKTYKVAGEYTKADTVTINTDDIDGLDYYAFAGDANNKTVEVKGGKDWIVHSLYTDYYTTGATIGTINASTATGNVTLAAAASIQGGAGTNNIWTYQANNAATVTAGTGTDIIWFAENADQAVSVSSFAAGTDVVKFATAQSLKEIAEGYTFEGGGTDTAIKGVNNTDSVLTLYSVSDTTIDLVDANDKAYKALVNKSATKNGTFTTDVNIYAGMETLTAGGSVEGTVSVRVGKESRGLSSDTYFIDDSVKTFDASTSTATFWIAGNANIGTTIKGGLTENYLYGGGAASDDLAGSVAVKDTFYFGTGDGTDKISGGVDKEDTIALWNVADADIANVSVSINKSNQVEISLSDSSKLTITDANGATALTDGLTFTSASQTAYTYDSESKTLVKKA